MIPPFKPNVSTVPLYSCSSSQRESSSGQQGHVSVEGRWYQMREPSSPQIKGYYTAAHTSSHSHVATNHPPSLVHTPNEESLWRPLQPASSHIHSVLDTPGTSTSTQRESPDENRAGASSASSLPTGREDVDSFSPGNLESYQEMKDLIKQGHRRKLS